MTSNAQKESGYLIPETIEHEDRICIQFEVPDTDEYLAAALGQIHALGKWWSWEKDYRNPNTRAKDTAEYLRSIINETLEIGDCMLDCGQVVDCVNEDENYIALSSMILAQSVASTQDHLTELDNLYDGSPQSVAPNVPIGVPDATQDMALCYAIEAYVDLYAATKLAMLQNKNVIQILWSKIKEAINRIFTEIVDFIAPIYQPNIYNCWVSDDAAMAALQDENAARDVACCLLSELDSVVMSETAFNDALSNCAVSLPGIAGEIACVMDTDNTLDLYLMFLEAYNNALQRQIDGEPVPCSCIVVEDGYTVDFTEGLGLWTVLQGTAGASGIVSEVINGNESVAVLLETDTFVWDRISVEYERQSDGSFLDDIRIILWDSYPSSAGRINWIEEDEPAHPLETVIFCPQNFPPQGASRPQISVFLRDNNVGNTITIKRVKVWSDTATLPSPIVANDDEGCLS